MITLLRIQNLVLIENTEISFGPGLNILTGETGAGKSVILSAIRLLSGAKADASLIRKNADIAVIEGHFLHKEKSLILRREIDSSGKSRSFCMNRQISLQELKKQTQGLLELVDQGTCYTLGSPDLQREFLDAFAETEELLKQLQTSFEEEKKQRQELASLEKQSEDKEFKIERMQDDLDLIIKTNWREEEESALSEKHTRHLHKAALTQKIETSLQSLSTSAPQIRRIWLLLEEASKFDSKLNPISQEVKSAFLELEEAEVSLRSYAEDLESTPEELQAIEERLSAIDLLKRRFGKTISDVMLKKKTLEDQLTLLQSLDEKIDHIQKQLNTLSSLNQTLAQEISHKRNQARSIFANQVLKELKSLNLPFASFQIEQSIQEISSTGIDQISFLFSANPGQSPVQIADCASGGELSRLLLSIKIVLSKLHPSSCLIFDEIDANVGGHSALILGEKLQELSKSSQIICITHFPQVAKLAMQHFLVFKTENQGRALTQVNLLQKPQEKQSEYNRMIGIAFTHN